MGNLTKSAIIVTGLMLLSKCLGLFREILLADCFGTSYVVDAYAIVCMLPSVFFALFASGFAESYIPVISRIRSERERGVFFSNSICILTTISLFVSLLIFFSPDFIVKLVAPGFEGGVALLTESFIRIIAFYLPFFVVFNLLCAQSAYDEDFVFVSFCNLIIVNLIIIISIILADYLDVHWLAYGYVLAMASATVVLGYRLRQRGRKIEPLFALHNSNFKEFVKMAIPIGASLLVNQLNAVVDKMFSSTLGEGVTSALNYANRLQLLPYTLIVSVFVSVCNPRMNRYFAERKNDEAIFYARKAFMIALMISLPLVFLFFFHADSITMGLLERGRFNREATTMTANCLKYYSVGIFFYAIRQIAANVLTANMKQSLVLKNTVITVLLNIVLNNVFIKVMGYSGLALSTSIVGVVGSILMLVDVWRMNLYIVNAADYTDYLKIIGSGTLCGIFCKIAMTFGVIENWMICVLIGIGVYCSLMVLLNVKIVIWLYGHVPNQFKFIKKWNR